MHVVDRQGLGERSAPPLRFSLPNDLYQLRVTLVDVEPLIWRRFLVPKDATLPRLHSILQAVMGWSGSHEHQFMVGEVCFGEPSVDMDPGPIDHARITVSQLLPRPGASCNYEYDFGDSWEHVVELEDEVPAASVTGAVPRCLAGERACPPEDSGGPDGYAELLNALRDPDHEEHDAYRAWLPQSFDPEAFDVDLVNRRLTRLARQPSPARGRRR